MSDTKSSPEIAPSYNLIREVSAADSLPVTSRGMGCNASQYASVHIQVVPSGNANPNVSVLWWSEAAGAFVQEQVPITKSGVGANTAYEFTIEAKGRIFFVAVTTLATGSVKIYASGYGLNATL
jgi:hypothetical protein